MKMKKTEDYQAIAFQKLHALNRVLFPLILAEKLISEQTMETLLTPMQSLDWEGKAKYADELITIMETSKTEQEIIERATCLPKEKSRKSKGGA